jgi:hypothetical protein
MTAHAPAYRLTLSAPRSTDLSETTVLVPIAGAAHTDAFKITTLPSLAGFKPYLDFPRGRRGRIEFLEKRTDTGSMVFRLLDKKAGATIDNLTRWVTAFLGSTFGLIRFGGLRVLVEESTNGGTTWVNFYTGRVIRLALDDSKLWYTLTVRDMQDDLTRNLFMRGPHSSVAYAENFSIMPVGPVVAYGNGVPIIKLTATVEASDATLRRARVKLASFSQRGATMWETLYSVLGDFPDGTGQGREPVFSSQALFKTDAHGWFRPGTTYSTRITEAGLTYRYVHTMWISEIETPGGKATGTPLANGALGLGATSLTTDGWTISITNIVKAGDVFYFAGHKTRYTVRANANSNGSGQATIVIDPPGLTAAVADNESLFMVFFPGRAVIPANGTVLTFYVTANGVAIGKQNPLVVRDVSAPTLWRDMLAGKFGDLYEFGDRLPTPLGVATGNPLVNGALAIGATSIVTDGWTVSQTGILKTGDYIGFAAHKVRYRVNADANSNGSGQATIVIDTGLVAAVSDNAVVQPGFWYGDPTYPAEFDNAAFNTFVADLTIPKVREIVAPDDEEVETLAEYVESRICRPCGLAYYLNGSGQVVPVDLRAPTTLAGVATLTDADLIAADDEVRWEYNAEMAKTVGVANYYEELFSLYGSFALDFTNIIAKLLPFTVKAQNAMEGMGNTQNLGFQVHTLDCPGFRYFGNETMDLFGQGALRSPIIRRQAAQALTHVRWPYGNGPQVATFRCRRTAGVEAVKQGDLKLLAFSVLPDPTTNKRGGTRAGRCVERREDGIQAYLSFVDMGANTTATTPTVGSPAQQAGNTRSAVTVAITRNAARVPVEVHYAVTTTAIGSAPAEASGAWVPMRDQNYYVTTDEEVVINQLPAGGRIWVRGRSVPQPPFDSDPPSFLPSAWVVTTFVDLANFAAPTGAAVSAITTTTALVTWTIGDADAYLDVRLATPASDPLVRIATPLPGTTRFQLTGLTASTEYKVSIRHTDFGGGFTAATEATFTTSASVAPASPGVPSVTVYAGDV